MFSSCRGLRFLARNRFLPRKSSKKLSSTSTLIYSDSERLQVSVSAKLPLSYTGGDILVVPFYKTPANEPNSMENQNLLVQEVKSLVPRGLDAGIASLMQEVVEEGAFNADTTAMKVIRLSSSIHSKYVALMGLGVDPKAPGNPSKDLEICTANRIGKAVTNLAREYKGRNIGVVLPSVTGNAGLAQLFLGVHEAAYYDERFRKTNPDMHLQNLSLTILGCNEEVAKNAPLTYSLADKIASGVWFAKDLVGAPANSKTPLLIADEARKIAAEHHLTCKVLGEEECRALGMGAYMGVQQGSQFPPQFIHLTYTPTNRHAHEPPVKIALVGKGLTFDSGGYNLKVGSSSIELMKIDMAGCAAVLGSAKAIAQLRPKNVEVHWISAVCENMISAQAVHPGDVLRASNGKTIEVINTDAEGRLTLADALVYAEKLDVDYIVDLATLTGAVVVALGEGVAGLYSSDLALRSSLEDAAKRSDESIWPLPLEASYKESIKSSIADLKNLGSKGGGSITAALFLQEFVNKTRWAHIDMAGPCWDSTANKPTGYGVKLLVDFILNAKKP